MALHLVETVDDRLACAAVMRAVCDALASGGTATVLVPSFEQALDMQRSLAEKGVSLGVTVTTPEAWAAERWGVWGTGERVVAADAAAVIMRGVVDEAAQVTDVLSTHPGTVRLLSDLARRALPWLPLRDDGSVDRTVAPQSLSAAELDAVALVGAYRDALRTRGLIEWCEVAARLPGLLAHAGVGTASIVATGFAEMERATRELVVGMARMSDVTVAARVDGELTGELTALALRHGIACTTQVDDVLPMPSSRSAELDTLLERLRVGGAADISSGGDMRLLEAAGPLAEAELIAREVVLQARSGATSVVVVTSDPYRAWCELAPKLVARGVSVRAWLSLPFLQTEAGRAFAEYTTTVADLIERAATWPSDEDGVRCLGDMGWWPPRALSDFLLSPISSVDPGKAARLDAAWRSNRLLTPADVLKTLRNAKATSISVERATAELMRGRIGSSASRLLAPLAAESAATDLATLEATAALGAVLNVSGTLQELDISADPKEGDHVPLSKLVELALTALAATSVTLRPAVSAIGATCEVRIMAPGQVARLEPASTDVVVACGLTSDEWPLVARPSLLDELLVELGVEGEVDQVRRERTRFWEIVAVARKTLLLERTLFSPDAAERWPSPLLQDVLSCYVRPEVLPKSGLGEDDVAAHLADCGTGPHPIAREVPAAPGHIDASLRSLVIVPPEGVPARPGSLPLLSASQIESYLECPYKWFSLRRLRLADADAACGPLEAGTFVHHVLELTRRRLLVEALDTDGVNATQAAVIAALAGVEGAQPVPIAGMSGDNVPTTPASPISASRGIVETLSVRAPGSGVVDEASLERAQTVLREEFDLQRAHQYLLEGGHAHFQALVAHSAREHGAIDRLRRDLLSSLAFERERFTGFEPRLLEWRFGSRERPVTYAGARIVGTVDRVDVNAHGQMVIIDYKHKDPAGFVGEYAAFGKDGADPDARPALPRRVQALIYAQVVRRAFPDGRIAAALYLGTRSGHGLAGAVSANQADLVFGPSTPDAVLRRMRVPEEATFGGAGGMTGMDAFLDAVEEGIAERIEELRAGNVEARPIDATACRYCPVMRCERRAV